MKKTKKPGDYILDKYMPDASLEDREEARRRLYAFVGVLLRIATRLEKEATDREGAREA